MFGSKDLTESMKAMAKKGQFDKLKKKYMRGSKEEQIALAKACSVISSDDSVNTLINLMDLAADDDVLIEIMHSIGEVGTDHAVSQVQLLLAGTDKENKKVLYDAVMGALQKLRNKG